MNTRPYSYKQIIATLHGCHSDLLDDKLLLTTTLTAVSNANMCLAKTKTTNPLVYNYRISVEEKALKAEFGQEYIDYAKKTKRLIPFLL